MQENQGELLSIEVPKEYYGLSASARNTIDFTFRAKSADLIKSLTSLYAEQERLNALYEQEDITLKLDVAMTSDAGAVVVIEAITAEGEKAFSRFMTPGLAKRFADSLRQTAGEASLLGDALNEDETGISFGLGSELSEHEPAEPQAEEGPAGEEGKEK